MDKKRSSPGVQMKGYVQVYTGNGKGKTTAALGSALRAAGAGMNVYIAQFMKWGDYSEIKALQRFSDLITVEQYGLGKFIRGEPTPEEKAAAKQGFENIKTVVSRGRHDMVIIEEGNLAVQYDLIPIEELLLLIDRKPEHMEIIITGRNADPRLIEKADLVTEMKDIKHYFEMGVPARVGIEK
ncbi:MAG: cob(I)yrinic acid a,c-diamide adenosyltransferase [Desulfobacterales bacterium]